MLFKLRCGFFFFVEIFDVVLQILVSFILFCCFRLNFIKLNLAVFVWEFKLSVELFVVVLNGFIFLFEEFKISLATADGSLF